MDRMIQEEYILPEDIRLAFFFFSIYLTFIIAHVAKREWPSGSAQRYERRPKIETK